MYALMASAAALMALLTVWQHHKILRQLERTLSSDLASSAPSRMRSKPRRDDGGAFAVLMLVFLIGVCGQLSNRPKPPTWAEYLMHFLPPTTKDALLGDLEERFNVMLQRFGWKRACFWYWCQALYACVDNVVISVKKRSGLDILGTILDRLRGSTK